MRSWCRRRRHHRRRRNSKDKGKGQRDRANAQGLVSNASKSIHRTSTKKRCRAFPLNFSRIFAKCSRITCKNKYPYVRTTLGHPENARKPSKTLAIFKTSENGRKTSENRPSENRPKKCPRFSLPPGAPVEMQPLRPPPRPRRVGIVSQA